MVYIPVPPGPRKQGMCCMLWLEVTDPWASREGPERHHREQAEPITLISGFMDQWKG